MACELRTVHECQMRASNMRAQELPTMAPAQGRWPLRMVAQASARTEVAVGNVLLAVPF
jgi:hypothetical protein